MLRSFGVDVCRNLYWMPPDEDVGKHLAGQWPLIYWLLLIQKERPLGRCGVSDEKSFIFINFCPGIKKPKSLIEVMLSFFRKLLVSRRTDEVETGSAQHWECQCNASSVSQEKCQDDCTYRSSRNSPRVSFVVGHSSKLVKQLALRVIDQRNGVLSTRT